MAVGSGSVNNMDFPMAAVAGDPGAVEGTHYADLEAPGGSICSKPTPSPEADTSGQAGK